MGLTESIEPRILPRPEHHVSRDAVSPGALKVLYRLHGAGYLAYLVGGSVRDLMLERAPKDFDVGTDARPNEVRRLFRNSRIIGRRFRLAHVMFQDGVVEVSTFRGDPDPEEQRREPGELLVTSDNTFGTPQQDAFRRDFTINALFYNIADFSVIDYVGGIDDLERRLVRVIGEADVRFREDPVRMLRACEFAGRLGFGIETRTQESIYENRQELDKASPARLTEELIQLLRCGRSGAAVQWMVELGLLESLLPEIMAMIASRGSDVGDFSRLLSVIDTLIEKDQEISDVVLLASVLLPSLILERARRERDLDRPLERARVRELTEHAVASFAGRFALSNQKTQGIFYALDSFNWLCEPTPSDKRLGQLVKRPSFEDAVQLFELMVRTTSEGEQELARWRRVAENREAHGEHREPRRRRRRHRRRR